MAEVQIAKVSIKHEAILDFIIANPTKPLGDIALHFNVTQPWLSVIIHSDAFQSLLRTKQGTLFGTTVIPLREKLLGVAHQAVDKLGETIQNASPVSDKQFIADTTDSILKSLGYSPKGGNGPPAGDIGVQNNIYVVNREDLQAARNTMKTVHSIQDEVPAIEGYNDTTPKGV